LPKILSHNSLLSYINAQSSAAGRFQAIRKCPNNMSVKPYHHTSL
jgi:hypothetical protein